MTSSSFEEYVLFSGLEGDAMLGEYRIFARSGYTEFPNDWTITATVAGEVVWVEQGVLEFMYSSDSSYTATDSQYTDSDTDDGSRTSRRGRRRLMTSDDFFLRDSSTYYYSNDDYDPETDVFTVTLGSYDPVGC